jgi:hypothetical protein
VFEHNPETFTIDGPRISWDLDRDLFSGAAAGVLAPGTTWQRAGDIQPLVTIP